MKECTPCNAECSNGCSGSQLSDCNDCKRFRLNYKPDTKSEIKKLTFNNQTKSLKNHDENNQAITTIILPDEAKMYCFDRCPDQFPYFNFPDLICIKDKPIDIK